MEVSISKGPVPAISRAVAILELLAQVDGEPIGAGDIAKQLHLARSSTVNICTALSDAHLLRLTASGYTLEYGLLVLGSQYLSTVSETQLFYRLCEDTETLASETARLAVLDGMHVIYLARYDGTQPLRLTAGIGDRFPATVTATGKAILAALPPDKLETLLSSSVTLPKLTQKSIASVSELKAELQHIRDRGFAIDDEETTPDVVCYAIPASFAGDTGLMAMSATVHKSRDSTDMRARLVADLRTVEKGLSHHLRPHIRSDTGTVAKDIPETDKTQGGTFISTKL